MQSPIYEFLDSFYSPQGKIEFEYLKGANFILDECKNCRTIFQKEIPNEFLMNKLYEEWIDPVKVYNMSLKTDDLIMFSDYAQEIMMLIRYFKKQPGELSFFDFGMGWGKWCNMAKAFGCESYGVELSKTRIEHAKSLGIKVLNYDELSNCRFDFINTEQVFEHISEPLQTLKFLKKSLKPTGLLKISVPNDPDIKKKIKLGDWTASKNSKNSLNAVSPLEHINCFNRFAIIKMADMAGLELVEMPVFLQLSCATNWSGIRQIFKNLAKPVYRGLFHKGTYLFFRHKK